MVLLKELDSQWFMRSWVEHAMSGIYDFLPEDYRVWIHWPAEQVGWISGKTLRPRRRNMFH